MKKFRIEKRIVGDNQPCFIVAEAGINHNGDLDIAKKMVKFAKEFGADAIKFQTFKTEEFISDPKRLYSYKTRGKTIKESMYEMFKRCELSPDDYGVISDCCRKKGIIFFSTPQNVSDMEGLMGIGVPALKIGSDDLTNLPLLRSCAKQGLPIIISTGMSYLSEIEDAVDIIKKYNNKLAILHCVSSYPASHEEINLNRITTLKSRFPSAIIGFSDHSIGITACIGAVALGAKIIEKHFTLNKNVKGPDHAFSMDPRELAVLAREVRYIEEAMGSPEIFPSKNEIKMRKLCRRSLVAARDIAKDEILKEKDLFMKRPGTGVLPKDMHLVIGKRAKKSIWKDKIINFEDLI